MSIKEVHFDIYCKKCKHWGKSEADDPCWECLNQGWNEDSHKPIRFEEGDDRRKNDKRSVEKI